MKKEKFKLVVLLMVLSITLLMVLQAFWLRAEYRAASDSFRRETNLLFRSTVQHIADSIFFSQIRLIPGADTLAAERFPMFRMPGHAQNASIQVRSIDIQRQPGDSAKTESKSLTIRMAGENQDSLRVAFFGENNTPANMRLFFNAFARDINSDSVAYHYSKALPERLQHLPLVILEKEMDWSQHAWGRQSHERNDSMPFTTGFMPLGMNRVYAASFSQVSGFLLASLMPQIGFSVFITGLILLSFIVVLRSLRAQQRLIEQKNDFIGNMTHELKTPVATVGVALEAMQSFDVLKDPEKAMEYIEMARHELDRLGMMADKILKTSVFDYVTDIRNNKEVVDLSVMVRKVLGSFQLLAEKKKIELIFDQEGSAIIKGHEEHLTQMIYNLVDNAFKYAGESPEMRITLTEQPDYVVLSVADCGPGIAEAHHSKIFDKFYRVPAGNVHTVKGYGLGLNYVAGVVNSHGGKIILESKPGAGAIFEVKLPKNA
jgi:two-component system, OmpR family, phosphate regulon sensor histidine kinase PhoR